MYLEGRGRTFYLQEEIEIRERARVIMHVCYYYNIEGAALLIFILSIATTINVRISF